MIWLFWPLWVTSAQVIAGQKANFVRLDPKANIERHVQGGIWPAVYEATPKQTSVIAKRNCLPLPSRSHELGRSMSLHFSVRLLILALAVAWVLPPLLRHWTASKDTIEP
jgi:hypothetical protein